jgi:hypothetical protein
MRRVSDTMVALFLRNLSIRTIEYIGDLYRAIRLDVTKEGARYE